MYHEIPSPEQEAELAAWWSQAFEALDRSRTGSPPDLRDRPRDDTVHAQWLRALA